MHKNARHAHQVWRRNMNGNEYILWTAINADGGQYLAVFNAGEIDGTVNIDLPSLELEGTFAAEELWSGEKSEVADNFNVTLPSHGAKAFLIHAV